MVLLFLNPHVLAREIADFGDESREAGDEVARRTAVRRGQDGSDSPSRRQVVDCSLMYGAGLRLMECLRLGVQDIAFAQNEITVRDNNGAKDRVTMLRESLKELLESHQRRVEAVHEKDLQDDCGRAPLPNALGRKSSNASRECRGHWVFLQEHRWKNEKTGRARAAPCA